MSGAKGNLQPVVFFSHVLNLDAQFWFVQYFLSFDHECPMFRSETGSQSLVKTVVLTSEGGNVNVLSKQH